MGLKCTDFFDNSKYESCDTQIMVCKECSSHLSLSDLILSDNFRGSSGPAYLVDNLINYETDSVVHETKMLTGEYLINKVRCAQCKIQLGWNYKKAFSYSEAYKEGKFVIEKSYLEMIPNTSSPSLLIEQVMKQKNRRRSSGATSTTSTISTESLEGGANVAIRTIPSGLDSGKDLAKTSASPSFDYRDVHNGIFLSRLRFQGIDKDDYDEDGEVFVGI